jgi:hypothetical protein
MKYKYRVERYSNGWVVYLERDEYKDALTIKNMLLKKGKRARIVYKGNVVSEEVTEANSRSY